MGAPALWGKETSLSTADGRSVRSRTRILVQSWVLDLGRTRQGTTTQIIENVLAARFRNWIWCSIWNPCYALWPNERPVTP